MVILIAAIRRLPVLITCIVGVSCSSTELSPQAAAAQAFDDVRAEVRETVGDAGRKAEVLLLIDQLEGDFQVLRTAVASRREEMRALNADYDATREQFRELYSAHMEEVRASHERFRRTRVAFVAATTPAEWSSMAKTNTKAMAALAASLQSI